MSMIPTSYRTARLYAVLPVDDPIRCIGLGFMQGDQIIRLCLSVDAAQQLIDTASRYLAEHRARTGQRPVDPKSAEPAAPAGGAA